MPAMMSPVATCSSTEMSLTDTDHKPRPDIQYGGSQRIEKQTRTFLIAGQQMIRP
jgi:hypothetical protein